MVFCKRLHAGPHRHEGIGRGGGPAQPGAERAPEGAPQPGGFWAVLVLDHGRIVERAPTYRGQGQRFP